MWMLHGLLDADALSDDALVLPPQIAPDAPLRLLDGGALTVLASDVSALDRPAGALNARFEDAAAAADLARAHDAILCRIVAERDVAPIRFGALVATEDGAIAAAEAGATAFAALRGAAEFRITVRPNAPAVPAEPRATPAAKPASGRAYLADRLARRRGRDRGAAALQELTRRLAEETAAAARRVRDLSKAPRAHEAAAPVFDAALLCDRRLVSELAERVDAWAEAAGAAGLSLKAVGPLPPFHFVDAPACDAPEQGAVA